MILRMRDNIYTFVNNEVTLNPTELGPPKRGLSSGVTKVHFKYGTFKYSTFWNNFLIGVIKFDMSTTPDPLIIPNDG